MADRLRGALLALAALLWASAMVFAVAGLALEIAQTAVAHDPWSAGFGHNLVEREARGPSLLATAL